MGKYSKERIVPIGKTALKHLETYIIAVRPYLLCNTGEEAIFLNKKGGRLHYEQVRCLLHSYAAQAGLDAIVTPHTFRRSCATEMLREGANIYHVKQLLGHETLNTLKHYAKLTITDLQKTHAKCHPRERDERNR